MVINSLRDIAGCTPWRYSSTNTYNDQIQHFITIITVDSDKVLQLTHLDWRVYEGSSTGVFRISDSDASFVCTLYTAYQIQSGSSLDMMLNVFLDKNISLYGVVQANATPFTLALNFHGLMYKLGEGVLD
jgi:hypothetical protein